MPKHDRELLWKNKKVKWEQKAFYRQIAIYIKANGDLRVKSAKLVSAKKILGFLDKNIDWIEKQSAKNANLRKKFPPPQYKLGASFPLLGYNIYIEQKNSKSSLLDGATLFLPMKKKSNIKTELRKAYKSIAEKQLKNRVNLWQKKMDLEISGLKIREYKARWGACSSEGEIRLNWKLVAAPLTIIDYVIVHELCHLVHMNHSPAFWNSVANHYPKYKMARLWLKENAFYFDFLEKKSQLYT